MLQMYTQSTAGVVTPVGEDIVFNNKTVQTGCTATADTPSNTVTLRRQGFYRVDFDAVIANNTAASAEVGVIMTRNDVQAPEAQTAATSAGATDFQAVSFSTIVRVLPNCRATDNTTRLQFEITGADVLLRHANVVVTKIA